MTTREFQDLTELCIHLAEAAIAIQHVENVALEHIGKKIEQDAKDMIGHYQPEAGPFPEWAPLAESTEKEKSRLGYPGDAPLLRDGTLRDSIEHEVKGGELVVGSKMDIAAYQEFGTNTIPPRPFIGPAAFKAKEHIEKTLGLSVLHALEYGTAGQFSPMPEK